MRERNHQIIVRLNDRELALLKKKMAAANMNYSDMIRMFITDREINIYPAAEMSKLLAGVSKIGSNINQLARVANSTGSADASVMTEASFQVSQLWRHLKTLGQWR